VSEAIETAEKKTGGTGVGEFIRETREEVRKVSFPSSDDVRGTTLIVIVNVIFFAIFLFVVDRAWAYILTGFEWLVNQLAGL
jgi:preprotein translocase subunit SecE